MKQRKKYLLLLLLIIVSGIVISLTYTFSKYVGSSVWDYYLKTREFYLSSDHLTSDNKQNIVDAWDKESTYFNVNNSQNELLITDYDIEYIATCRVVGDAALTSECLFEENGLNIVEGVLSASKICVNDDGAEVVGLNQKECEENNYSWEKEIARKDVYFNAIFNEEELSEITVEITLESTVPYKKTLIGTFLLKNTLVTDEDVNIEYEERDNTGTLILSNPYLESKIIEISWNNNKLLIDKNSPQIDAYEGENNKINKIYIILGPKSSTNLLFYKIDESKITENDFNINIIESEDYTHN